MSAYATPADFEAYVEGWTTDDEDALLRLLERATGDIDKYVGPWPVDDDTGRRFLVADGPDGDSDPDFPEWLSDFQVEQLVAATCAQAEYRLEMGESFMVKDQHASTSTGAVNTSGKLSRIGPKVVEELSGTGLVQHSALVRSRRRSLSGLLRGFRSDG